MASSIAQEAVLSDDNLLTEIFSNLPIRTLLVFKTVCKHWRFIINHPYLYHQRPTQSGLFLKLSSTGEYDQFLSLTGGAQPSCTPAISNVSLASITRRFSLLQSCNGLLLFHKSKQYHKPCKYEKYLIYNPITAQFATAPAREYAINVSLAFDPVRNQWPEFTLICLREQKSQHEYDSLEYSIEVYSSKTGGWRSLFKPLESELVFLLYHSYPVYWNGAIHWINDFIDHDSIYLDIEKGSLLVMPKLPVHGADWKGVSYVANSKDHLHLIENFNPSLPFNIYELRRDYTEWFVRYRVNLSSVISNLKHKEFSCLSVVREDTKVDRPYLILCTHGSLIRYNLDDGSFAVLHDFGFRYDHDFTRKSYCPLRYLDWRSVIPLIEYFPSGVQSEAD